MAESASKPTSAKPKTTSDLEADIAQLRADIQKLTKDLRGLSEHSVKTARRAASDGAEHLRSQGEAAYESARASAQEFEDEVTQRVREKPMTSLAIAAGAGFLFALLARR